MSVSKSRKYTCAFVDLNARFLIVRAKEIYRRQKGDDNIEDGILLWLESGECSFCLFVDDLLGEQQVVVKQLPSYVNSYNIKQYGINGCTLLGDGSISIILDVANLYVASQEF
ncbi:MAG: chemotaxis protein CheW [Oscillospiraceae bacterium]|nr:chemotaxis protein CheW [Oscillospiraceae bacterium]